MSCYKNSLRSQIQSACDSREVSKCYFTFSQAKSTITEHAQNGDTEFLEKNADMRIALLLNVIGAF